MTKMESFLKYLESYDLKRVDQESNDMLTLDDNSTSFLYVAIDNRVINLNVVAREKAATLVVVNSGCEIELNVNIGEGGRFNLLEMLYDGASDKVVVNQAANSALNSTIIELSSADVNYIANLNGSGVDCEVNILQLPFGEERINANLRIAHNSSDCTSRSTSKCAASGKSVGEFHGLIYVAQDAQRTSSEQNSRNVALSRDVKIVAEPQLEIYADDVKCTHGATVGQMNKDAILYMRQRGLSEEQARKLQLEGFVSQIVEMCAIEQLHDVLNETVSKHLQNM